LALVVVAATFVNNYALIDVVAIANCYVFVQIICYFFTQEGKPHFPEILFIYYTVLIPAAPQEKPESNPGLLRGSLLSASGPLS
jgi:heme/copper-type cytochrome/quinol oxidase subunit 4